MTTTLTHTDLKNQRASAPADSDSSLKAFGKKNIMAHLKPLINTFNFFVQPSHFENGASQIEQSSVDSVLAFQHCLVVGCILEIALSAKMTKCHHNNFLVS